MKRLIFPVPVLLLTMVSIFCGDDGTTIGITSLAAENDTSVQPARAIAYIRNGTEIRLIDPDAKNDRRLWIHPDATDSLGLFDLAWRPDGKELAFSSAHEAIFSIYHADIYGIRPDGSGFRKITNQPGHKSFKDYKKGSISVTVRNNQYTFQQAESSAGVFIVNIIGADEPQMITLAPGSSKTIVFKSVADFGEHAQALVAIYGNYRWFMPGTDVVAGKNIKAPDLIISGDGIEYFGAFRPVWNHDGSQISFRDGVCIIKSVPALSKSEEVQFNPLFNDKNPLGTCVWDMGTTPALANQVIYSENTGDEGSGIYIMKNGSTHDPSSRLTSFSDIQYQLLHDLKWLPDGSGFMYSTVNLYRDAANIFRYDIQSKQTTQITQLKNEFARRFSIAPDGKRLVYERAKTNDDYKDVDLWVISSNGSDDRLLMKNGLGPAWSR